jgi:hypothetical protein
VPDQHAELPVVPALRDDPGVVPNANLTEITER